ncbi:hypothetical protein CHELA20_51826 [Hyphomicrobiales bacterium]|nr:hypothetical protein CHELA41_23187 [Hyphomicrobiales bacterium]CAH1678775.1 hypothetical protein CHELA20_51826 [Hyphomicrobiales bacterium]
MTQGIVARQPGFAVDTHNRLLLRTRHCSCAAGERKGDRPTGVGHAGWAGGVPEWLKGTDCKSVGYAYVGSNPTPSTIQA